MWTPVWARVTGRCARTSVTTFGRHRAICGRGVEFGRQLRRLLLFVLDDFEDFAARPEQLSSFGEQPSVLGEVGDKLFHVVTFHFETQSPDGRSSLPLLLAVKVRGLLRANRQLGCDPGKTTAREGLNLLQG
jgi:hypothetical protein